MAPQGREPSEPSAQRSGGQSRLATAIEKALVEGKVSPELRGQVRTLVAAEAAQRIARGDTIQVPVYDARAPRGRSKTISPTAQRTGDRERAR